MTENNVQIIELTPELYPKLVAHMQRHVAESGVGGVHFMPFAPGDEDRPVGILLDKLLLGIGDKGWHRCWVAIEKERDRVVGHVDLKGSQLRTSRHRCELGLGIETEWRGQGLGNRLLDTAIAYARSQALLYWIDLNTFSDNSVALALYHKKGFKELSRIPDRYRIKGKRINDVSMTLCID